MTGDAETLEGPQNATDGVCTCEAQFDGPDVLDPKCVRHGPGDINKVRKT